MAYVSQNAVFARGVACKLPFRCGKEDKMAANSNYYGYSAGVQGAQVYGSTMQNPQMTQSAYTGQTTAAYGAQSTTPSANAYGTASPRSVMPSQSAYTPTAASSYQTTGLSGSSYGYTARVQDTASQSYQTNAASAYTSPSSFYARDNSQASTGYDASKTGSYYGQHSGTTQSYGYGSAPTKSMYTGYSAPSNTNNQMASPSAQIPQKPNTSATASNVSYPYKGQTNQNYNQNSSSYTSPSNWSGSGGGYQQTQGYDAAVYNAASSYFQQQTQPRQKSWGNNKNNNSNNNQNNKSGQARLRNPPRQQQVHYCDVCKISCAGPQV
jgi:zinc finger RNA-binding protein